MKSITTMSVARNLLAAAVVALVLVGCSNDNSMRESSEFSDFVNTAEIVNIHNLDTDIEVQTSNIGQYADAPARFLQWCRNLNSRDDVLTEDEKNVPIYLVQDIPVHLLRGASEAEKRDLFVCLMLPHIYALNMEFLEARAQLASFVPNEGEIGPGALNGLTVPQKKQLIYWMLRMAVIDPDTADVTRLTWAERRSGMQAEASRRFSSEIPRVTRASLDSLFNRLNMIPPSQFLAQGAQETGWGADPDSWADPERNMFGLQYPRHIPGAPWCRPTATRTPRCALKFDSIFGGAQHYTERWNSGPYPAWRARRESVLTRNPGCLTGTALVNATTFAPYAEDGRYAAHIREKMVPPETRRQAYHTNLIQFDELVGQRTCAN